MKVVKVYGALREKLGRCRFEFVADTPAQALRALIANFPDLERWLIDSEKDGVGYRVTVGKERVTESNPDSLHLPWSEREVFSITPVLTGAGGGPTTQIIAGAAILALSFGIGAALSAGVALGGFAGIGTIGTAFAAVGAGLVLNGVASIIAPTPSLSAGPSSRTGIRDKDAVRLESFSFSGIVNTTKQGLPVPIIYGRAFAGSAVLSVGIESRG
jgi:predicted phage tail protein